jgi:5-methylcytosine-specific restriction enzyme A
MSVRRTRSVDSSRWGVPDRNERGEPICRWCRGALRWPRRTFCGEPCVHEWRIRSSPAYVREQVWKRDQGVCQRCRVNIRALDREWRRLEPARAGRRALGIWRRMRPRWEADHILPVADGGGECGLENYRLLCRACHLTVTLEWRGRRHAG